MSHTAEIIAVGTEILLGNIANTDAQMLSQSLSTLGVNVFWHTVVGDNPQRLREALDIARHRADIILTTGGLGPTYDDLTKQTICAAFGQKLVLHEDILEDIRAFYQSALHVPMPENNTQQAELPEGCTVFDNPVGTAPGCAFEADGVHVLMLPGPPHECETMLRRCVEPYLRALSKEVIVSHDIMTFGMGESSVDQLLHDRMVRMVNPTLATYAKPCEVRLRATAKAAGAEEAEAMLAPVVAEVRAALGDYVYGVDVKGLEAVCFQLLKERQENAGLKGSPDRKHKPVGTILGIGGFEMNVVVFRLRAWAGRVLTDIFSLDIPFSRMKGGKNPVFGKLKSIFQHENKDKVSAAAGAVLFIDAEALQTAVCEIRHGGRGEENSFHGKPPFFLWKDWKRIGLSVFTE